MTRSILSFLSVTSGQIQQFLVNRQKCFLPTVSFDSDPDNFPLLAILQIALIVALLNALPRVALIVTMSFLDSCPLIVNEFP